VDGLFNSKDKLTAKRVTARTVCWLNVDKPTKQTIIHHAGCKWEVHKTETTYKGIGEILRDGGWLQFDSEREAVEHSTSNYPAYAIKHCLNCS